MNFFNILLKESLLSVDLRERGMIMDTYILTAFDKTGKKLLDETFTAENQEKAKELGKQLLLESGNAERTHRCVSSDGRLLLFHR